MSDYCASLKESVMRELN